MSRTLSQRQRIGLTVAAILCFIAIVLGSFVHRVSQPRLMSASELKVNGLFLMDPPRGLSEFELVDHHGQCLHPRVTARGLVTAVLRFYALPGYLSDDHGLPQSVRR